MLTVLDLGELELHQAGNLPSLTHLICSLPYDTSFDPSKLPALKQLIFTGRLHQGPTTDTAFAHLHNFPALVHIEAAEEFTCMTSWSEFSCFKLPPTCRTLAMKVGEPGTRQFMEGIEQTALPLVTHLWYWNPNGVGMENNTGHTIDGRAFRRHLPRLQHLIYDFAQPDFGEFANPDDDVRAPWTFIVPDFPVTLLMPIECLDTPWQCTPPTLMVPYPKASQAGHKEGFRPLKGAGQLYKWQTASFRPLIFVTCPQEARPVLHLPGRPAWGLARPGALQQASLHKHWDL